ncbi:hypothetical protein [Burkholderia vietnamiensis]|uniref:hypothetical protein n=1 Tax=Burkholderia vietnamiensis TaxID=60552 RepID=UPI003C7EC7D8
MDIRPLHTEDDYRAALAEVSALVDQDPEPGTPKGDRLEILSILVEHYEGSRETAYLLRSPSNAAHLERSIKALKGILRKPARSVSIDDMNMAARPREGWAAASKAISGDIDSEMRAWLDMPAVGSEFGAPRPVPARKLPVQQVQASFGGSMVTISKLDAAVHQLNLAITLFLGGDYLASLTLAGAAEDILGGLCKAAGKPTAAEFIANYHEKDVDPAVPAGKRLGVVFTVMNRARNAAKHADRPDENTVDLDQMHPLQMLMRAIPMCAALGVKPSDEIKSMVRWVKAHPEAQQ